MTRSFLLTATAALTLAACSQTKTQTTGTNQPVTQDPNVNTPIDQQPVVGVPGGGTQQPPSGGSSQPPTAGAPVYGTFVRTGPPVAESTGRPILLPSGRVLLAEQEYDPASGQFTHLPPQPVAYVGVALSSTALLKDGRVLAAGGMTGNTGSFRADAFLYDPSSRTYTRTGSLVKERYGAMAVTLKDGRVLIAGGQHNGPQVALQAELYDPQSGTFAATGSLAESEGRFQGSAILLNDGRVLIVGGNSWAAYSAEVYDPTSGNFSKVGAPKEARCGTSLLLLVDGRVLVAGNAGCAPWSTENVIEVFDPSTNQFSVIGKVGLQSDHEITVALLPTGQVLLAGGLGQGDGGPNVEGLTAAYLFDPGTGTLTQTDSMNGGRYNAVAVTLLDGRVLVLGGVSNSQIVRSAELFVPRSH